MKTVTFHSHPEQVYYTCSEPGDQDGEYVRVEDVGRLTRDRDALLAIVKVLARWRTGPRPNDRGEWIDRVLTLAEEARAAIAAAETPQ